MYVRSVIFQRGGGHGHGSHHSWGPWPRPPLLVGAMTMATTMKIVGCIGKVDLHVDLHFHLRPKVAITPCWRLTCELERHTLAMGSYHLTTSPPYPSLWGEGGAEQFAS